MGDIDKKQSHFAADRSGEMEPLSDECLAIFLDICAWEPTFSTLIRLFSKLEIRMVVVEGGCYGCFNTSSHPDIASMAITQRRGGPPETPYGNPPQLTGDPSQS